MRQILRSRVGLVLKKRKSPGTEAAHSNVGIEGKDKFSKPKIDPAARLPAPCSQSILRGVSSTCGSHLDGTPVRAAADLQLRLALLKDRRSRRIRHVAPRRRGDGARREEREPAARYSSRNQASRNTSS